ncbi:hypothetical protein [Paenibacillus tianmuensis]|uniref:hypothetical protein n=1 Tax=Paenibacillus tianmuensis TaxID=624147 RepID=UPI001C26A3F5|nr:hypothetical protein [Paenibacillus tianmuensis]
MQLVPPDSPDYYMPSFTGACVPAVAVCHHATKHRVQAAIATHTAFPSCYIPPAFGSGGWSPAVT